MKVDENMVSNWPEALVALTVAPEHNKLLLEYDTVRVLDTFIRPNEITALHTHRWPATLYILSWSDFVRYGENDNVVVDSRNFKASPQASTSFWTKPLTAHRLNNVGENYIHVISVENNSR